MTKQERPLRAGDFVYHYGKSALVIGVRQLTTAQASQVLLEGRTEWVDAATLTLEKTDESSD
jgi:hypothetical protein